METETKFRDFITAECSKKEWRSKSSRLHLWECGQKPTGWSDYICWPCLVSLWCGVEPCAGWNCLPAAAFWSEFEKSCPLRAPSKPAPAPATPRTVLVPNTYLPLCAKKTNIHAMRFIASGNVFSGSLKRYQKLLKEEHCKQKLWNLLVKLERFFLSFENTFEKEYVVHWRTLLNLIFFFSRHG